MKPTILHHRACKLLGVDPAKIRLVGPAEWQRITGYTVSRALGISDWKHGDRIVYVRHGSGFDTYIHEVLHHLFPSRQHRWIFAAAWKLANVRATSYAYGYGRGFEARPSDVVESRAKLLRLAHQAAIRLSVEGD